MNGAVRSISVRLLAEVGNYVHGFQRARAATGDLVNELSKSEQQRQNMQRLGTGMLVAGAGIAAGIGLATKAAVDWESAFAGVEKTVDGTEAQLAGLEDELREMARSLPATHAEIAAVAEAAGQLGVATEDVADFTRVMIDLGESTNLTADEAATAIAQLMNVMGTAPDDVDRLGSALVELGNNGASTERQIVMMAQRIAGAGAIVGASEADVLALANALASAGIEVEAGGSAISRVLVSIASAAAEGGGELEAFADVAGVSAEQFAHHFSRDPVAALNSFILGLSRMSEAGENVFGTLDQLGLSETRTRNALLALTGAGDLLTGSLEDGERAWGENLALTEEAGRRYDTTAAKLQVARNQLNDFAIVMGEVFLPVVGDASEKLGGFAEFLGGLPEPVVRIVAGLAALTAGVALVGGTALIAVPKIAAYNAAVASMHAQGGATAAFATRMNRGLRRTTVWAGRAAAAFIALEAAGAVLGQFRRGSADVELLASALEHLSRTGVVAGEMANAFGTDLDGLRESLRGVADESGTADFLRLIDKLPGPIGEVSAEVARLAGHSGRTFAEMSSDVEALDSALTQMVDAGLAPEAWDLFQQMVVESGMAIGDVEDAMPRFVAAHKEWLLAQQGSSDSLSELGETAGDAAANVEELAEAFTELFDLQMDLDRAVLAYKQGIADLREELEDGTRTLKLNSQAGRDNRSAVLDQIEAVADLRQANLDNGMSMDEANEKYDTQLDKIQQMLLDLGFQEEAVQGLIDTYRLTPAEVVTDVSAPFLGPVSEDAALYLELLERVDDIDTLKTIMSLPNVEERLAMLRRYRDQLDGIDGRTVQTTILQRTITQQFGVGAPTPERWGGLVHAQAGRLVPAHIATSPTVLYGERATGVEAYIPMRGDRDRSLGILAEAAGWYGARVETGVGGPWQWHGARPAAGGSTGGGSGGEFTGQLFLDSGELLGVVRGQVRQGISEHDRGVNRRLGAGAGRSP